ncbi:MAG: alpha/beta fold hydrolase [Dehalococcoidia bacterium]
MITGASVAFVERGGVRLRVFHAGDGPLVVLLHGYPELAYSWRHQFGPLVAAGFRVAAPDQRGYGGSSSPPTIEDFSLEQLAADVVSVIDHFGERSAVVIGHDWGAPVAWRTALRHPERVHAVGSLSVPHAKRSSRPPLELMREAAGPEFIHYVDYFQEPGRVEKEFEADVRAALLGFLWSICGDAPREERFKPIPVKGRFIDSVVVPAQLPGWLTTGDLDTYAAEFERTGFRGGLNWYRNMTRNWEESADLGDVVAQPALFVTGSRDPARNPGAMAHLRDVAPNLVVEETIEGCGHWTQQERPERVSQLLTEFVQAVRARSRTM